MNYGQVLYCHDPNGYNLGSRFIYVTVHCGSQIGELLHRLRYLYTIVYATSITLYTRRLEKIVMVKVSTPVPIM